MDQEQAMRSPFQEALLASLNGVLLPVAKLMLKCGLGCSEFIAVAKGAFVQAASEDYGLRGRPTNSSRIAAMTGLSRKEVSRIRMSGTDRWTPDMEVTPANSVLHYWHFDPKFSEPLGSPKPLPIEGKSSFAALVRQYAGDIPVGAIRKELQRAGTVGEDEEGRLVVRERFFYPSAFDEDFIRNAAFALRNLGNTLVHNAKLAGDDHAKRSARFERFAWSDRLSPEAIRAFKAWVAVEGARFVEAADDWIGEREGLDSKDVSDSSRTIGVGVYYFEEE